MDPLSVLSEEVIDVVFSNFTSRDIIISSLVSHRWFSYIANNRNCMKKLHVNITCFNIDQFHEEHVNALKNSVRKYEVLKISNVSLASYDFLYYQSWRRVELKRVTVNENVFKKFLCHIDESIEDLRIDKLDYYDDEDENEKIETETSPKFLQLKRLELKYVPYAFYNTFSSCRNLNELFILSRAEDNLNGIQSILYSNSKLKKLSIVSNSIDKHFQEDISSHIKFQLTHFEIRDVYNLTPIFIENFKKFLEKQSSLETLDLGDWINLEIIQMIFHMTKLKTLTFKGFYNIESHLDMDQIEFNKSQSITTLNLIDTFSNLSIMRIFLQACPSVTNLRLYSLNEEGLKVLCQNLPTLKKLSVDLLEIKNLSSESDDLSELQEFRKFFKEFGSFNSGKK